MKATRSFSALIHQIRSSTSLASQSHPHLRSYSQRAAHIQPLRRSFAQLQRIPLASHLRYNSTIPSSPPKPRQQPSTGTSTPSATTLPSPSPSRNQPSYSLTFTCSPCTTRSTHTISKQGYHNGTVLITCPDCKNRHVISDHLKIFSDTSVTIETLMRDKGELVKRGSISGEGDVEFWDGEDVGGRKRGGTGVGEVERERAREEVRREVDDL